MPVINKKKKSIWDIIARNTQKEIDRLNDEFFWKVVKKAQKIKFEKDMKDANN